MAKVVIEVKDIVDAEGNPAWQLTTEVDDTLVDLLELDEDTCTPALVAAQVVLKNLDLVIEEIDEELLRIATEAAENAS